MLEGKNVDLRIMEKEDLPFYLKWVNDPSFFGEYYPLEQETKVEMEKEYDTGPSERKRFFVEKKDGTKIGVVGVFPVSARAKLVEKYSCQTMIFKASAGRASYWRGRSGL